MSELLVIKIVIVSFALLYFVQPFLVLLYVKNTKRKMINIFFAKPIVNLKYWNVIKESNSDEIEVLKVKEMISNRSLVSITLTNLIIGIYFVVLGLSFEYLGNSNIGVRFVVGFLFFVVICIWFRNEHERNKP